MKIKLFNRIDEVKENISVQQNEGILKENIQQLQINNLKNIQQLDLKD